MPSGRQVCTFVAVGIAGFAAGLYVAGPRTAAQELPAPRAVVLEDPPNRALDGNLWMHVSAEYRACCYQAYNLARRRLKEKVQSPPPGGWAKPPAVVLDLDETVLDNGEFQARLIRNGLAFDPETWNDWERSGFAQVRLVPGAKAFIDEAKRLGVAVVYITNRQHKKEFRISTGNALELLEIDVPTDNLLAAEEDFGPDGKPFLITDKTARRAKVERRHTVLLYLGDNLRDFHEGDFKSTVDNLKPGPKTTDAAKLHAAIAARAAAVDRCEDLFGREWIILPNPAYGEWAKVLNLGNADKNLLTGQPSR
ncbi:MAG TPA: HAD family acid phosphatase [Gemmataceae bacterium]|jgi:5'-nucleotidase (lipoprotein e(P4) family)|nr:HAD family acid phosphatase [Gemmataceae bacterium]